MIPFKLYIVIAVHNRRAVTLNCLKQLGEQRVSNFEVIVVDDGSTDGTYNAIRESYPAVNLIRGERGDWWWTKSVNYGIKEALEKEATHILLLNDDTYFSKEYISDILLEITKNPASVIGSLNITHEQPSRIYFSGVSSFDKLFFKYHRYQKTMTIYNPHNYPNSKYPSVYLPARGLLIPSTVLNKIGLLDEVNFPQYFSDVDFTLRAYENRIDQYICHKLIVSTPLASTGGGDFYKGESFFKFIKSFSNRYSKRHFKTSYVFIKKHVPLTYLPISFVTYQTRILLGFFKARLIPNLRK